MKSFLSKIGRFFGIQVEHGILHTQSKGCWLCIHIRYTVIYCHGWWREWQGFRVELNAPLKSHQGHGLGRWRIHR